MMRDNTPGIESSTKPASTQEESIVTIMYTDGACRGNPGPGGWGVYVASGDILPREYCGGEQDTTNNRMELMAAIEAIKRVPAGTELVLYTDSQYVNQGINSWIENWKRNGWKTSAKKPVKNADLWQELDAQVSRVEVDWRWVKGHSGDPGNEAADRLANKGIDQLFNQTTTNQ